MPAPVPAATFPIARVLPLIGLSHLDRGFDYRVSEADSEHCQPGVRVRVRFSGRLVDGIVLERCAQAEFDGTLRYIERVISPCVVYPPQLARLVDSLAQRYAAVRSDIIRSAIPPRHARAEDSDLSTAWQGANKVAQPDLSAWSAYDFGESFVDHVLAGEPARAAWNIAPGADWAQAIAALATKVALDGGGVIIVVPDQRDLDHLAAVFGQFLSPRHLTVLSNSLGPQARYRRYLSILNGNARVVIGTRSAAFAPVHQLQLAVIYQDGDEALADPIKPYIHAREVLSTRSAQENCSFIIAHHGRTAETQLLVEAHWAHNLLPSAATVAATRPHLEAVGPAALNPGKNLVAADQPGTAMLTAPLYQALRGALGAGDPVLVQVPRSGFAPALACGQCRSLARCRRCHGPLAIAAEPEHSAAPPACRWCGRLEPHFRCQVCGSSRLRAAVAGSSLTAEQLGRIFSPVPVIVSGGGKIVDEVSPRPALVIATPGAEPRVANGGHYGAAVLLDPQLLLNRPDMRATEAALARWFTAATMVKAADDGGQVLITGDPALPAIDFLVRWDPVAAAAHELAERRELRLPPAVHFAAVDGPEPALDDFLAQLQLAQPFDILGPVPLPPGSSLPGEYDEQRFGPPQRIIIRTPLGRRGALGESLRGALQRSSARKDSLPVRIQVDPRHVG